MKSNQIAMGTQRSGLELGKAVRFASSDPLGDNAVAVVYKADHGQLGARMLVRANESVRLSTGERALGGCGHGEYIRSANSSVAARCSPVGAAQIKAANGEAGSDKVGLDLLKSETRYAKQ